MDRETTGSKTAEAKNDTLTEVAPRIDTWAKRVGLWGGALLVLIGLWNQLNPFWVVLLPAGMLVVGVGGCYLSHKEHQLIAKPFVPAVCMQNTIACLAWAAIQGSAILLERTISTFEALVTTEAIPEENVFSVPLYFASMLLSFVSAMVWGVLVVVSLYAVWSTHFKGIGEAIKTFGEEASASFDAIGTRLANTNESVSEPKETNADSSAVEGDDPSDSDSSHQV